MNGSLVASIALMYAILIGLNIPAPLLGLKFPESGGRRRLWFEPPGYIIPVAWFVLFTMLGIARHELEGRDSAAAAGGLTIWLAVSCAAYAYYTLGLAKVTGVSALWYGLLGNSAVIFFALVVAYEAYSVSRVAALLILPVAVWTSYATAIVIGEMRAQGLV